MIQRSIEHANGNKLLLVGLDNEEVAAFLGRSIEIDLRPFGLIGTRLVLMHDAEPARLRIRAARVVPLASEKPPSIVCPACDRASFHPQDIENGWCAACNSVTSPPRGGKVA